MKKVKRPKCNIFHDAYRLPYDESSRVKLHHSIKGNLDLVQRLGLLRKLPVHTDCVNTISWNETGEYILSGSDDQRLVITNGFNYKVATDYKTTHRANIFSAKFLPYRGDTSIVSCSGDGIILYTDLMRTDETRYNQFNCHTGTTYKVATVPFDPNSFLSCGEDGMVRWFDIRRKEKCFKPNCDEDVIIACQRPVTALAVNATLPYQLAVGCADSTVRIYDRRMLVTKANVKQTTAALSLPPLTVPTFKDRSYRITSLSFSPEGEDILVSYSSDHLYLFNVKEQSSMTLRTNAAADNSESSKRVSGESHSRKSPPMPVRRLRLRGDWSDTGPNARPEREGGRRGGVAQARPTLHGSLMERMTFVLSRMLNDPVTRAALSGGGEDALQGQGQGAGAASQRQAAPANDDEPEPGTEREPLPESAPVAAAAASGEQETESVSERVRRTRSKRTVTQRRRSSSSSSSTPESGTSKRPSPAGQDVDSYTRNIEMMASSSGLPHPGDRTSASSTGDNLARNSVEGDDSVGKRLAASSSTTEKENPVPSASSCSAASGERSIPERRDAEDGEAESETHDELPLVGANSRESIYSEGSDDFVSDSDDEDIEHRLMSQSDEEGHEVVDSDGYSPIIKQKYTGHRNARTMIKEATFWGSEYVMSGSDCGHIFIWERLGGRLVMLLQADEHVVNCLQPHPSEPLLASSGIDHDIKLWAPMGEESLFDDALADELTNRNALMLEETRDTITVPASFMIRMLACLNQIRRGGRGTIRRRRSRGGQGE